MNAHHAREQAAIDQYEPLWRAQGYEVIRQPGLSQRPAFLTGFQPDVILLGKDQNVVVEVVQKGQPGLEAKVRQLRTLLDDRGDWRLEVIYAGVAEPTYRPVSKDAILETLSAAQRLRAAEPRAALLLLWSTLEAIGRRLSADLGNGAQAGPGRIVETLAHEGTITPTEADLLRHLVGLRNRIVHGEIDAVLPESDIERALTVAEQLTAQIPSGDPAC